MNDWRDEIAVEDEAPLVAIEEALAIEGDWHGIEPCEGCGLLHSPVWAHVDFDSEDSHLADMLRQRREQVIADWPEERVLR